MEQSQLSAFKKAAAVEAARLVEDGMVVGLGTGSTAALFVDALAERIARERIRIVGVPTSDQTAQHATRLHIPLATFAQQTEIDLTVDGADEIERGTLFLIKGLGGALLHEKIVAAASKRMVVIADETKVVNRLGSRGPVPVEVVQFGWQVTLRRLEALGSKPKLRLAASGAPFVTDSGNYIIDCAFGPMENPKEIAHHLDHVVGAVEHGLFLKLAREALVGGQDGVKTLRAG
jgi:ribose 5-phosphate isomerase A